MFIDSGDRSNVRTYLRTEVTTCTCFRMPTCSGPKLGFFSTIFDSMEHVMSGFGGDVSGCGDIVFGSSRLGSVGPGSSGVVSTEFGFGSKGFGSIGFGSSEFSSTGFNSGFTGCFNGCLLYSTFEIGSAIDNCSESILFVNEWRGGRISRICHDSVPSGQNESDFACILKLTAGSDRSTHKLSRLR